MTINHGNLVLLGLEKWANINIKLNPAITAEQAFQIGFDFIGGQQKIDTILKNPHLEIIPITTYRDGTTETGYEHILVWSFIFRRESYLNTWEMLVDAQRGKLISFQDINQYILKKIVGSIYPIASDECCPEGCAIIQTPMLFTNTGFSFPNDYTNLGGLYEYSSGTVATTLDGKYVIIGGETCGIVNESSLSGDIALGGANGEHNCTVPAGHSSGDTFSARTVEAEVTMINRIARSWANYSWLDTPITANVNIPGSCYSDYTGTYINFSRSGEGCRNSGEIASLIIHEWGHALDNNDTNAVISNPAETFPDLIAGLRLHKSCIGRGFYWTLNRGCGQWTCPSNSNSTGYNCSGYGDCCLNCTGQRDIDWDNHSSHSAHTPANYICTKCINGVGPCGKEWHCESPVSSEAGWDLAKIDFQSAPFYYDKQTAFELTTRLSYIAIGNIINWYTCTCPSTSDGCSSANGYMQWIAADDDDGNISNGTPHISAIYSAFNRHGIACSTPSPANSGCASEPSSAPTLIANAGDNSVQLSWNSVPGASQYNILRTEGHMGCDFGKIKIAAIPDLSFLDTQALNGRTYYYSIQPVGSNSACLGPLSNCQSATPGNLPGTVPDNDNYAGTPLTIDKSGANLQLTWGAPAAPCLTSDYAIYRGTLPWATYNHSSSTCSTAGNTFYTTPADTGSYYFLVVAQNDGSEGSYGLDSSNNQRPAGSNPCLPQNIGTCN